MHTRRLLKSLPCNSILAFRPRRTTLAAALLIIIGAGCGEPTAPPEPVATVTLAPASPILLVPGGHEALVPTSKGASGRTLSGRDSEWSSSDSAVAQVSAGLVTGVKKGTATVTVTVEGKPASVSVEVRDGGVVTSAGASFSVFDGAVSVTVPAGAVTSPRNISVRAATNPPPARRFVQGSGYEFGPDAENFQQAVTITIKYDPAAVSADSPESGLQLYEAVQNSWQLVPGSTVDLAARTVSGNVTHMSTYGVLMQPIVDTVRVAATPASIVVKTSFQFTATLKDSAGVTLTRPIAWTTSASDVLQIDAVTGVATALIPGTAIVTATSEKKSGTITVTVVPGPAAHMLRVTSETVNGAAGVALESQPAVKVTDAFGNAISGFSVTFAVASGGGSVTGGAATTSVNGFASPSVWTLGTTAGSNTLSATGPGLPESPIIFTAIGNPGAAAVIAAVSETSQAGTAGGLVTALPSVKVTDSFGNSIAGITVAFTPASGSGSVSGGNATTNSSGIATVGGWRLAPIPGTQTLQAVLAGVSGSPVTFTAAAAAPVASSMVILAGNSQTAVTLSAVLVNPAVRITDPAGVPVPGFAVTFAVTGGGGTITGGNATTNADGVATVGSWVLGSSPGDNTLSTAAGALTSVVFNASAIAPIPVAIAVVEGQNQTAQAGSSVVVPPSVKVTDAQGRGVPGIAVTFSVTFGSGSLTSGNTVTNSHGIATVGSWTLGLGNNTVTATAPGLAGNPIVFQATGEPFIKIVTFGDSNTDLGYEGTSPSIKAASYVSNAQPRLGPGDQNSSFQLAGKIEARWRASRSEIIVAVNHGIAGTRTGTGRTALTSPNALAVVNGRTRFEGEVLGLGYPWSGGEPTNSIFPNGAILRVQAFKPRSSDFVYLSMGTNDVLTGVSTDSIVAHLSRFVDTWVAAGLPLNHFIITTLAPLDATANSSVPVLNVAIRALATQRQLSLIDLARETSNDDGSSWKSSTLHIDGDVLHYSEEVRSWLADQVFGFINAP